MSNVIASAAAPTQAQIQRLVQLGVSAAPATRSEASAMISRLIAQRDMAPATPAQIGRAGALGGRDLPGAGVREKSTQIYLLEALAMWDAADENDPEAVQAAVDMLVSRVRERLVKPLRVTITAPVDSEQAPF